MSVNSGTSGAAATRYRSERAISATGSISWVIVDAVTYELHGEGSGFTAYLRQRGLAVNTERTYAGRTALYLSYCAAYGVDWASPSMVQLARFLRWLVDVPIVSTRAGEHRWRSKKTANAVMTTVCEFLRFGALQEWVPAEVVARLTQEKYLSYLPQGYSGGERGEFRTVRAREIKFAVAVDGILWLTMEEVDQVLQAATQARDRFLVGLLWVTGLRIGEALGLRREDLHFLASSKLLGCQVVGPHVHVRRRENVNGAWAKSPVNRTVPVTMQVVGLYADYVHERDAAASGHREVWVSDFVFVNLFRPPFGRPMSYPAIRDLFQRLAARAGLTVRPHMIRHSAATAWIRQGQARDVVSALLGHQSPASLAPYVHASDADKRAAVERVAAVRLAVR